MKKPELLAPAGNMEKLKFAVLYGADAVYLGGQNFGLREKADNFSLAELEDAINYAHQRDVKVYVTVNIFAHNRDLEGLADYITRLEELEVDAVIVADPGVFSIVKETAPELDIHISTQANNTNYSSVNFWHKQGARRVILAREMSLAEIKEIKAKTEVELEAFVHGAMCISYSGRCLLSNYLTGRDANQGLCANSCRWEYQLVEEKRPGQYYTISEDERGTYIFNSKDLNTLAHLPEIIETGIDSLKIEGRMKSVNYTATVTKIYRKVIDQYFAKGSDYEFKSEWAKELKKVSHRGYTTGFYFGEPGGEEQNYDSSGYIRDYDFVGVVRKYLPQEEEAIIEVRNKIWSDDSLEIVGPNHDSFTQQLNYIIDQKSGERIDAAPHPKQRIKIKVDQAVNEYSILRRKKE